MAHRTIQAETDASGAKFAVVAGRFNSFISEKLVDGAIKALVECGASDDAVTVVWVPGSYEIPLISKKLAETGKFDGVVAVGAVIRGETLHFELIANELSRGLMQVSMETSVPVTFGVITADTVEQATARAGGEAGNKGAEAAVAAVEMVNVLRTIKRGEL
ncbi:MAG: 6,7-dimethyl-8-ribityllumazine synthase [Candidatus Dadabacteria bacterium]|nr:MAG: 6,7-dimethyl-8-ribityllumazine synthase [Candidatus Dadabacteria bacterium]